jgi:hypothetical protein
MENYNAELREIFTNLSGWVEKEKNQFEVIKTVIDKYNELYDRVGNADMEPINTSGDGKEFNFKKINLDNTPLEMALINEAIFLPYVRFYRKQTLKEKVNKILKKINLMNVKLGVYASSASGSPGQSSGRTPRRGSASSSGRTPPSESASSSGRTPGVASRFVGSIRNLGSRIVDGASSLLQSSATADAAEAARLASVTAAGSAAAASAEAVRASKAAIAAGSDNIGRIDAQVRRILGSDLIIDAEDIPGYEALKTRIRTIIDSDMPTKDKQIYITLLINKLLSRLEEEKEIAIETGNFDNINFLNDLIGDLYGVTGRLAVMVEMEDYKNQIGSTRYAIWEASRTGRIKSGLASDRLLVAEQRGKLRYTIELIRNKKSKTREDQEALAIAERNLAEYERLLIKTNLIHAIGGGMDEEPYRSKYLKYKNKYLQLKRNLN